MLSVTERLNIKRNCFILKNLDFKKKTLENKNKIRIKRIALNMTPKLF